MHSDVATSDLEDYPGALCRIDLASGELLDSNRAARDLCDRHGPPGAVIDAAQFATLIDMARGSERWAELELPSALGRMRLRLKMLAGGREGLLALDPQPDAEHLDALLDMVADLRWEWDLTSDRAVRHAVGSLQDGAGIGASETSMAELYEIVHPDDRERVEAAARDYLQGRSQSYRIEYRIRNPSANGTQARAWHWVLSRGRIVERAADGRPLRVAGLITDITARREERHEQALLEAQLRHVQKLDALGQLTGGIAHDFNNILASVLGYSELGALALRKQGVPAEELAEKVGDYLEEIRGAADRGRELIAKMLMFSRGGPQADVAERVAPLSLIDDTVRMLRPVLPATLAVKLRIDEALPPLGVDPTQLQQIMLNLIINARDAVGENGLLTITAGRAPERDCVCASCAQTIEADDDLMTLTVSDDGPGIPRALLDKIFDPFFTTKEAGRGSGLGLSVVHGIIHEHGGHIGLVTGDEGTEITLMLPIARDAATQPRRSAPRAQAEGRGRKVLIIDDEAPIGRWMAALLEEHGFVTDVHEDPQRALRRFNLTPDYWDLIITDQAMPGLSGVELADELLAASPGLPIIICSGFSEFVEANNAPDFGFRAFLDKPVSGDALLDTVIAVLDDGAGDGDSTVFDRAG